MLGLALRTLRNDRISWFRLTNISKFKQIVQHQSDVEIENSKKLTKEKVITDEENELKCKFDWQRKLKKAEWDFLHELCMAGVVYSRHRFLECLILDIKPFQSKRNCLI